jgi:hypothetical protein
MRRILSLWAVIFIVTLVVASLLLSLLLSSKMDEAVTSGHTITRFLLGTIYIAPDNCDNAYWLTCFDNSYRDFVYVR